MIYLSWPTQLRAY